MLRINRAFGIENPRNYPAAIVEELREWLIQGVSAHPDPERENFYDVQIQNRVFFIYVSPSSSNVTLLAVWLRSAYFHSGDAARGCIGTVG